MDRFFDEAARAAGREAALAAFPAARGRTTILVRADVPWRAPGPPPTTRASSTTPRCMPSRSRRTRSSSSRCTRSCASRWPSPRPTRDRLIDGTATPIDVNDLLFVVDLLVTDYSSIVFEFSTLGRPMLFYAYDLDEYIAERDFYVPFEAFVPGRIVRTFDALLDAIRREDYEAEKVGASPPPFRAPRRHSTDRVIDELDRCGR